MYQNGEGFIWSSIDCTKKLTEADPFTQELILNRYNEFCAAVMCRFGEFVPEQWRNSIDFIEKKTRSNMETWFWKGQPIVSFAKPFYSQTDDSFHQQVYWYQEGETY
ncbi:MAG: hypothetical protein KAS32_30835 [Candidatus Peribacteraceae bacterium]|nr:hypothetical protein [Candidatus Peribacteraceae bacterium]